MSRIFDALQRSGTEQSGIEYPDMVSVAREVFEAARNQPASVDTSSGAKILEPPPIVLVPNLAASVELETSQKDFSEFPSLKVSILPSSRLVFHTEPDSLASEKFRFLGVRLRHMQQIRPLKKILITSTIPEEGKSLVSANLAGVLARRKQKVLLIEGDLRRPVLAEHFGLRGLVGLGEWLRGGGGDLANIYRLDSLGFCFMPAGNPPANPLELMQSGKLSQLMEQLVVRFDWIIVDSPPLLPLADTTVWARLTEGTLLVAREGITQKTALQQGLEALKKSDLLGVVLNGCTRSAQSNYYGYVPK